MICQSQCRNIADIQRSKGDIQRWYPMQTPGSNTGSRWKRYIYISVRGEQVIVNAFLIEVNSSFGVVTCTSYKKEEKAIRDILKRNCIPRHNEEELKLVVYYKSPTVSNLVMKNNLSDVPSLLRSTNVVYKFKCPSGDCAHQPNSTYIGHTTTTMSRRITMHLQDGAPLRHHNQEHNTELTREMMVNHTSIIARCSRRKKLKVLEAVYIRDMDPAINRQMNMRGSLTLFDSAPLAPRAWTSGWVRQTWVVGVVWRMWWRVMCDVALICPHVNLCIRWNAIITSLEWK